MNLSHTFRAAISNGIGQINEYGDYFTQCSSKARPPSHHVLLDSNSDLIYCVLMIASVGVVSCIPIATT